MRDAILLAVGLALLTVTMIYSFIGPHWETSDRIEGNQTGLEQVTNTLFNEYPVALIIMALVLATSMVGGVFLAKMEGRP